MSYVKIYDCFLFFDEVDQLEIRLAELGNVVDVFVLCEGTKTFGRDNKDLIFERNKGRFSRYLDRIVHLVFDDGNHPDKKKFAFENSQRDSLVRGLPPNIGRDDIVIVSDVDEVPSADAVRRFYTDVGKPYVTFRLHHYMYYLNALLSKKLNGPVAFRHSFLGPSTLTDMRKKRRHSPRYGPAGWHFSCLGGWGQLERKIKAYSHSDIYSRHIPLLKKKMENGLCYYNDKTLVEVPIDDTFPACIRDNPIRWKSHIWQST